MNTGYVARGFVFEADADAALGQYDDDPSPYSGTYSEM